MTSSWSMTIPPLCVYSKMTLHEYGFVVTAARNGVEALAEVQRHKPEAIPPRHRDARNGRPHVLS